METRTGTWVVSRASPGSRFRRTGFHHQAVVPSSKDRAPLPYERFGSRAMCGDVVEAMKTGYVGVSNMWTNDHGTKRGTNSESHSFPTIDCCLCLSHVQVPPKISMPCARKIDAMIQSRSPSRFLVPVRMKVLESGSHDTRL